MDFESLKEQAIDKFFEFKNRVQDSELYIRGKDGYDNLSPSIQSVVKVAAVVFVVYFFYMIPASYVSSAEEKMEFFEENRLLTRDLIRAGRIARTIQLPPMAPSVSSLTNQVESRIKEQRVLPEQIANTAPLNTVVDKSIVPRSIKQSGVKATVNKLNLTQMVRIAESLNQINGSKLMNIAIQADSKDPHYFSVDYEIAAFSVPQAAPNLGNKKKSPFKSRRKKGKNR